MQTQRVASAAACSCLPTAPIPPGPLTIGQVAQLTGLRAKTIRYYEDSDLLPQPPRGSNGYRRYRVADVNRIVLLQCIRHLGVPLAAARPFLMSAVDASCAEVQAHLRWLVRQRLQALDREIAEMRELRTEMEDYLPALDACPSDATEQIRCVAQPPSAGARESSAASASACVASTYSPWPQTSPACWHCSTTASKKRRKTTSS